MMLITFCLEQQWLSASKSSLICLWALISRPAPFLGKTLLSPSATLSGNRSKPIKNADGRDDGWHSNVYTAKAIREHPEIQVLHTSSLCFFFSFQEVL
jgi:hypothetical protein